MQSPDTDIPVQRLLHHREGPVEVRCCRSQGQDRGRHCIDLREETAGGGDSQAGPGAVLHRRVDLPRVQHEVLPLVPWSHGDRGEIRTPLGVHIGTRVEGEAIRKARPVHRMVEGKDQRRARPCRGAIGRLASEETGTRPAGLHEKWHLHGDAELATVLHGQVPRQRKHEPLAHGQSRRGHENEEIAFPETVNLRGSARCLDARQRFGIDPVGRDRKGERDPLIPADDLVSPGRVARHGELIERDERAGGNDKDPGSHQRGGNATPAQSPLPPSGAATGCPRVSRPAQVPLPRPSHREPLRRGPLP